MNKFHRIGGMATIAKRINTLEDVVKILSKQLEHLVIYLNDHIQIPNFLSKYANVEPVLSKNEYGNISANGKLFFMKYAQQGDYCFTFDDDILYPTNYTQRMIKTLNNFNNQVGLCVHGGMIPDCATWYFERTTAYPFKMQTLWNNPINLIGSGTFCFYNDKVPCAIDYFLDTVAVDLKLSMLFLENNFPLISIKRERNWLKPLKYKGLWEKSLQQLTIHSKLLLNDTVLKESNIRHVWLTFLNNISKDHFDDYILNKNINPEFLSFLKSESLPLEWRGNDVLISKIMQAYKYIY